MVRRRGGSARAAGALVALVLALPTVATANHGECAAGSDPPCPVFEPDVAAGVQQPFVNADSSVTLRVGQADHQMPAVRVTHLLPKGWRFAVNSVRPGQKVDGSPATQCSDVFFDLGDHDDGSAAILRRAEAIAPNMRMRAEFDGSREVGPRNKEPRPVEYGVNNNGSLSFLRWDDAAGRADLCWYLYARDVRLDHSDDEADPCNQRGVPPSTAVTPSELPTEDPNCEAAREHLIPVTLEELRAPDPLAETFGWRVHYDVSSFWRNAYLFDGNVSLLLHTFYLAASTAGNWHVNEVTGVTEPAPFSRAPAAPGVYEIRSILETCAEGMQAPPAASVCVNDTFMSVTISTPVTITLPPSSVRHDFGVLTGPAGPAGMPAGSGLVRNAESLTITWRQPPAHPVETIKGYALTIAPPGDQDRRHFEYLVTDPTLPGFDGRAPCGADGLAPTCSLPLSFPLTSVGGRVLEADGLYDIALVTIYRDGHRSDRRCDDGTGPGAPCPPLTPSFIVLSPGVSTWRVLLRREAWPNAYVEVQSFVPTGGGKAVRAPAYMLLVDFALKRAEFVVWSSNPTCVGQVGACLPGLAAGATYTASSNGIAGSADTGAVSFGSHQSARGPKFSFDGFVFPPGAGPPHFEGTTMSRPEGRGLFVIVDDQGLPGTPNGMPTVYAESFEGVRLA